MAIDWAARQAAAEAELAAAQGALTDDDVAERAARDKEAATLELAREKRAEKRDLDIARRLDAAKLALGPGVPVEPYVHPERDDAFIVRAPTPSAFKRWEAAIDAANNKRRGAQDPSDATRELALSCIYDWNGETDLHGIASRGGAALLAFAKDNGFVLIAIAALVQKLGGYQKEARKS